MQEGKRIMSRLGVGDFGVTQRGTNVWLVRSMVTGVALPFVMIAVGGVVLVCLGDASWVWAYALFSLAMVLIAWWRYRVTWSRARLFLEDDCDPERLLGMLEWWGALATGGRLSSHELLLVALAAEAFGEYGVVAKTTRSLGTHGLSRREMVDYLLVRHAVACREHRLGDARELRRMVLGIPVRKRDERRLFALLCMAHAREYLAVRDAKSALAVLGADCARSVHTLHERIMYRFLCMQAADMSGDVSTARWFAESVAKDGGTTVQRRIAEAWLEAHPA